MPFAENNGVRLHWQERGEGSPVLLIMGHRYSSSLWYPLLPALTETHRAIWFDNRGTGESDTTKRVTLGELAGDALAVMDAAGVDKAHVFGVSMGGGIAIELALQAPQRVTSLLLGCTGIFSPEKVRAPSWVLLLYRLPPWVRGLLRRRRAGDHGYGSAAAPDAVAYDQAMVAKDKSTVEGLIAQATAVNSYVTSTEAVAGLTMPALVLHGDEDAVVSPAWGEELAATLPNNRFVKLAGAGHNFFVAAPEETNAAVLGFLADVDAGRPVTA